MHPTPKEPLSFQIEFFEKIIEKVPNYFQAIEILAHLYTKSGRLEEGLKMDMRATKLAPTNASAFYNLACSLCLLHRYDESIAALEEAVNLGYHDANWLLQDTDLVPLHTYPKFLALIQKIRHH